MCDFVVASTNDNRKLKGILEEVFGSKVTSFGVPIIRQMPDINEPVSNFIKIVTIRYVHQIPKA